MMEEQHILVVVVVMAPTIDIDISLHRLCDSPVRSFI
jgi:hypothetical protein